MLTPKRQTTADPMPARHLYVVVIGDGTFVTHPLHDGAKVTIGRSKDCEISINDESLSRKHAVVTMDNGVTIEDLGSANGTTVRGQAIAPNQPTEISVGEVVNLGSSLNIMLQHHSRPVRPRRLWTHQYFEARLEEECARVERGGAPFAVLRIRAENSETAALEDRLGELVRASDILGKFSAHEYELLLPETPPRNADDAVRRMDAGLRERGLICNMTVACCPRDGRSPYELLTRVQRPARKSSEFTAAVPDVVVSDPQMQNLHRLVEQVASSQISVLLLGETGVGKEVFARALHRASTRAEGPFVELNCAALTETLLESELFGHEKGAFTNALSAKAGLIESADGGTLLLDEIGDMPLSTQAKLLRVIEDSQLRRVGGLKTRHVDVRFVAATNSDLEAQVANARFRSDLFFRLNGVTIVIPALRERLVELEDLARAFIRDARPGARQPTLSPEALDLMRQYSWPGNIRELKHMMARAVLLCGDGPIRVEHLPADKMRGTTRPIVAPTAANQSRPLAGSEDEERWIRQALEQTGGNQTLAAKLLGISRRTLVNRLNLYEVERPRKDRRR